MTYPVQPTRILVVANDFHLDRSLLSAVARRSIRRRPTSRSSFPQSPTASTAWSTLRTTAAGRPRRPLTRRSHDERGRGRTGDRRRRRAPSPFAAVWDALRLRRLQRGGRSRLVEPLPPLAPPRPGAPDRGARRAGHRRRRGRPAATASPLSRSNSASVSSISRAARFSLRCSSESVPGIVPIVGDRRMSHARADLARRRAAYLGDVGDRRRILAAEREVGDEGNPLRGAVVDLVIVGPRDEAVLVLHGGDGRDLSAPARLQADRHGGDPDVPDPAGLAVLVEHRHRVLDGEVRMDTVLVVELDHLGLEVARELLLQFHPETPRPRRPRCSRPWWRRGGRRGRGRGRRRSSARSPRPCRGGRCRCG